MAAKGRKTKGKKNEEENVTESTEESTNEVVSGPAITPKDVFYCPHCRYPVEYCEFSNCFEDKCLPYLKDKFPELAQKLEELRSNDKHRDKSVKSIKNKESSKNVGGEVLLKQKQRTKNKYITTITGLENYDIDLDAYSKTLKKKLATGVSVSYDPEVELEIQGEMKEVIYNYMINEWKIPNENIFIEVKKENEDGTTQKKKVLLSTLINLKIPEKRDKLKGPTPEQQTKAGKVSKGGQSSKGNR